MSMGGRSDGGEGGHEAVRVRTRDKGAGKVRPRTSKAVTLSNRSRDLAVGSSPHSRSWPGRRYPSWLLETDQAVCEWVVGTKGAPSFDGAQAERAVAAVKKRLPVKFASCPFASRLAHGDALGVHPGAPVKGALCSLDSRRRFYFHDAEKNRIESLYYVREAENVVLDDMTWHDLLSCAGLWRDKSVCWRECVAELGATHTGAPEPTVSEQLRARANPLLAPALLPEAATNFAALHSDLNWEWLRGLLSRSAMGSVHALTLCAMSADSAISAHYSARDTMLCQVKGARRVLLVEPRFAHRGMYPYPVHHPLDGFTMVRMDEEEYARPQPAQDTHNSGSDDEEGEAPWQYPAFSAVRGREVILRSGDALFIPAFYFVHSHALDGGGGTCRRTNVCLELDLNPGPLRSPTEGSAELVLSRVLEEQMEEQVEGKSYGKFHSTFQRVALATLGGRVDGGALDASTVSGHRFICFVEHVVEQVEAGLGKGAVTDFLQRMISVRLNPAHFKFENVFGSDARGALAIKQPRNPLLLQDKPYHLEDDRSELEKKYPEFFRSKLSQEGWSVPAQESNVPIPGYNMPSGADYKTYGLEGKG